MVAGQLLPEVFRNLFLFLLAQAEQRLHTRAHRQALRLDLGSVHGHADLQILPPDTLRERL